MKTGRLSIQEKYVIQGMIAANKTVDEISQELDRTEKTVQNYIDKELNNICETVAKTKVQSSKKKKGRSLDMMTSPKNKGVVIMTEGASQRGENFKNKKNTASKFIAGNVYRISDGKKIEHGDSFRETKTGPLNEKEKALIIEMVDEQKTLQQICVALNRKENDIIKFINTLS